MVSVAGVDGTPGGWAIVAMKNGRSSIQKVARLTDFIDHPNDFKTIAVDVPIGLLDVYEMGGRSCDRAARKLLGKRASSVFPAPVRATLLAKSYEEACACSRASAPHGRGISKQTYSILDKIREVDDLLQKRLELRDVVREVHPEVCFRELADKKAMEHNKSSLLGRENRRKALSRAFSDLSDLIAKGRALNLPIEDILDAAVACWSAHRLANNKGRNVLNKVPLDKTGLPMTIWF